MKIEYLLSLSAALFLWACSEPTLEPAGDDASGRPIAFAPSADASLPTDGTAFAEGTQIGLYCVESGDDPAAALAGSRAVDNKCFTVVSGELTSTTPCFWATEYTGPSDFYAYTPYRPQGFGAGVSVTEMEVEADQRSAEAFSRSDWMLAVAQNVPRSRNAVPLRFRRLTARIDFVLVSGVGYNGTAGLADAGLKVLGMARVANVDLPTATVFSPAIRVDMQPHGSFRAGEQAVSGVSAIVVPQTVEPSVPFVQVEIGQRKFCFVTGKSLQFEAGKRYTFTLRVDRIPTGEAVLPEPGITPWEQGTSSSGDAVVVNPDDDITSVVDVDGNEYAIVTIGTQKWLGSNLRATHLNDGTPLPFVEGQDAWADAENTEQPGYCRCENDPDVAAYGLLYNWFAAATGRLCPEGWRIPARTDWETLAEYLGREVAGRCVKATSGWHDAFGETKPEYQGTDSSGFGAQPTGYRKWNRYEKAGVMTTWWTTTVYSMSSLSAHYARVQGDNDLLTSGSAWGKESGCSVRCIKATE